MFYPFVARNRFLFDLLRLMELGLKGKSPPCQEKRIRLAGKINHFA